MVKKRKILIRMFFYTLIFILFFIVLPTIFTKIKIIKISNNLKYDTFYSKEFIDKKVYLLPDSLKLSQQIDESNKYKINIESENEKIYDDCVNVDYAIDNSVDIQNLYLKINNNIYKIEKNIGTIKFNVSREGKNMVLV